MKPPSQILTIIALFASVLSLPAQAAFSWNFNGNDSLSGSFGNTKTFAGSGTPAPAPSVTASAWANTGTGSTLQTAYIGAYNGGLGVTNRNEGTGGNDTHSLDNGSNLDSILFNFGSTSVGLSTISVGFISNLTGQTDSDLSILAFTGGSGAPSLGGKTYTGASNSLLSSGWEVIGNYANVGSSNFNINASGKSASYWLVVAYNSAFGSSCLTSSGSATTCTNSNDYVKISGLSANINTPPPPQNNVPEPATLLLFSAGLFGLIRARKI